MLDYSFNDFVTIYSLYFVFFIIYLEEDIKKKRKKRLDIGFLGVNQIL